MAENPNWAARSGTRTDTVTVDAGLRSYMLGVYNYMAIALGITGVVAFVVSRFLMTADHQPTQLFITLYASPLKWVVMLAPLLPVVLLSGRIRTIGTSTAQMTFWAFAALMGLSIAYIFVLFTEASIASTFFATAAAFGALSIWGYTTKRDLSPIGSFLIMGVWGLIIAMVINFFMHSQVLQYAISAIGVVIFAVLTAFDTQRIKEMYFAGDAGAVVVRKSILGALRLYLDFINLFLFLLQFLGNRR